MDAVGKVFAVIVVVFAVFLVPMVNMSTTRDEVTQSTVYDIVSEFVDDVRVQGYVSQDMYLEFTEELDRTGNLYDIEMIHSKEIVTPVFDESGKVVNTSTSEECFYTADILQAVYEDDGGDGVKGVYLMNQGDSFSMVVKSRTQTTAQRLRTTTFKVIEESPAIYVTYGGVIRDENY